MQRRIASITALILTLTTSPIEAAAKPVKQKNNADKIKLAPQINLQVSESNVKTEIPKQISFGSFSTQPQPKNFIDEMPVKPEFKYALNDDDYSSRSTYEQEIKLKVNLDF